MGAIKSAASRSVAAASRSLVLLALCLSVSNVADAQSGTCRKQAANPCSLDGSSSTYAESFEGGQRVIRAAGCPNNNPVNECVGDNPAQINTQGWTMSIPSTPQLNRGTYADALANAVSLSAVGGMIGILLDGTSVLSCYGGARYGPCTDYASSANAVEGDTFTQCGGHGSPYHYHIAPVCLLQQLGPRADGASPQVGWAADGFPIYGNRGPGGVLIKRCGQPGADATYCMDQCGGLYSSTYGDSFVYRYFLAGEESDLTTSPYSRLPGAEYFPFSPLCLLGCGSVSITSTSGDRTPRVGQQLPACTAAAGAGALAPYTAALLAAPTPLQYSPKNEPFSWTAAGSTPSSPPSGNALSEVAPSPSPSSATQPAAGTGTTTAPGNSGTARAPAAGKVNSAPPTGALPAFECGLVALVTLGFTF